MDRRTPSSAWDCSTETAFFGSSGCSGWPMGWSSAPGRGSSASMITSSDPAAVAVPALPSSIWVRTGS